MTLSDNYRRLLKVIEETALGCGRDPSEIALVTVSKFKTLEQIQKVYNTGARDFGENRVQEFLEKIPLAPADIRWHFIGTLQKNKVRKIIGKCVLIHSVDSFELAEKISECSEEIGESTRVLLEVNIAGETTKHGFSLDEIRLQWNKLSALPNIAIAGLMTMAPNVEEEAIVRSCFRGLKELGDELGLRELSMGMTHDYRIAIEEGATMLRIGSAIFGE